MPATVLVKFVLLDFWIENCCIRATAAFNLPIDFLPATAFLRIDATCIETQCLLRPGKRCEDVTYIIPRT